MKKRKPDRNFLERCRIEQLEKDWPYESKLSSLLEFNKINHDRQVIIKNFIVDFVFIEKNVVLELDGSFHFKNRKKDLRRDRILSKFGFTVLRFWNHELDKSPWKILEALERIKDSKENERSFQLAMSRSNGQCKKNKPVRVLPHSQEKSSNSKIRKELASCKYLCDFQYLQRKYCS